MIWGCSPYFRFPIRYISQASILPNPIRLKISACFPHTTRGIAIRKSMSWSNSQVNGFRVSGLGLQWQHSFPLNHTWRWGGKQLWSYETDAWDVSTSCFCSHCKRIHVMSHDGHFAVSKIFVGKIADSCSSASTQKFGGPVKVVELDHWNSAKAPPKPAQRSCETKSSDFLPGRFRASAFFSVPRIGYHRAPQKRDSSLQLPGCWINNSAHWHTALVKLCVFLDQLTRNLPKKHRWILVVVSTNFCFHFLIGEMMKHVFFCFSQAWNHQLVVFLQPTGCTIGWDKRCLFCSEKKLLFFCVPALDGFYGGRSVFFAKWGEPGSSMVIPAGTNSCWRCYVFFLHFFKVEKAPKWLKNLQFPKNSIWTSHELTKINLERTIFFVNRKTTLAQKKSCSSTLCQSTTQLQFAVLSSPGRCFSHLGVILGSDFVGLEDPLGM